MKRLYILISNDLAPIYGAVQGGHAVAQWLIDHPNSDWSNDYLIYLTCDINVLKERLDRDGVDYSVFAEPDLDYKMTAIAVQLNDKRYFKNLKMLRS